MPDSRHGVAPLRDIGFERSLPPFERGKSSFAAHRIASRSLHDGDDLAVVLHESRQVLAALEQLRKSVSVDHYRREVHATVLILAYESRAKHGSNLSQASLQAHEPAPLLTKLALGRVQGDTLARQLSIERGRAGGKAV